MSENTSELFAFHSLFRIQSKLHTNQCIAYSGGSNSFVMDDYTSPEPRFHFRVQILDSGAFLIQSDGNNEMVQAPRRANHALESGTVAPEDPDPSFAWVIKPADIKRPGDGAVIVSVDLSDNTLATEYVWDVEASGTNAPVLCYARHTPPTQGSTSPYYNQRWTIIPVEN